MPLHYFHLQNRHTTLDDIGTDVADLAAARAEAIATVAAVLQEDSVDAIWDRRPLRLWVTEGPGDTGKTLLTLRVASEA